MVLNFTLVFIHKTYFLLLPSIIFAHLHASYVHHIPYFQRLKFSYYFWVFATFMKERNFFTTFWTYYYSIRCKLNETGRLKLLHEKEIGRYGWIFSISFGDDVKRAKDFLEHNLWDFYVFQCNWSNEKQLMTIFFASWFLHSSSNLSRTSHFSSFIGQWLKELFLSFMIMRCLSFIKHNI